MSERFSPPRECKLSAIYTRARVRTFRLFTRVGVSAIYTSARVRIFRSFAQVQVLLLRHATTHPWFDQKQPDTYVCNATRVIII